MGRSTETWEKISQRPQRATQDQSVLLRFELL